MFVFRKADKGPAKLIKKRSQEGKNALQKLNSYLNAASAEPTYLLTQIWNDQKNAITYKEIRQAIENGYMNIKTLQAWQEDYAGFVNQHLRQTWIDSMKAANATLTAQHPLYFFDPMDSGIQKWINEHGANWVTAISDEQKEAVQSMLNNSYSGAFTVDELSRAIRATVGLTKPQTTANLNYYNHIKTEMAKDHPKMKPEDIQKVAEDKALKYAARQHRYRAFTIATTEMAFAYNKGADEGIRQAQQQNLIGKVRRVWSTAADENVCQICGALNGQEIDMDDDFNFNGSSLYDGQKQTPPAHPRCRCAIAYKEIEPPKIQEEPEPDLLPAWDSNDQLQAPEPAEPPKIHQVTMPDGMEDNGPLSLGGTGEMHSYKDASGQEWIFKPAQTKSGMPQEFRAYIQEAGYKVQSIVDPDTAVPVGTGTLGDKFGAFQTKIDTLSDTMNLKSWQQTGGTLPDGYIPQLQREDVTDWLLGNFDSHGGNFIVDDTGKLIGVDKEQSFRYINDIASHTMDYKYHPNASYGETEPIYNTLYRKFANGEIDMELQDTLPYIKRVEAIPDKDYREIFRPYAESMYGKEQEAEKLLDQIVERKDSIREDFRNYYSKLLTERTGKTQQFIWADETPKHLQQPLSAVSMTPDTLAKMSNDELKQLAKVKQIPHHNSMNKAELITCISDPVQAPNIVAQVKARKAAAKAARNAAKTVAANSNDIYQADDVFSDLSIIPEEKLGIPIRSDHGKVEGLNLTARKMNIGGNNVYEVSGKLTYQTWEKTEHLVEKHGTSEQLFFEKADDAKRLFSDTEHAYMSVEIGAQKVEDGNTTLEIYNDDLGTLKGWRGWFRVRTPDTGNGATDAANISNMLQQFGLGDLTGNTTIEAETLAKKARLVWQNAPQRVPELTGLVGSQIPEKLDEIIKEEGIEVSRLKDYKVKKVFDGYSTYVEEGISKIYKKAGLIYEWVGVPTDDMIVKILQSQGLMANNYRFISGQNQAGESPMDDFESGGSDNVFTRIGVKTSKPQLYTSSILHGRYQIIIDLKEMDRTDWYAYSGDSYGATDLYYMRTNPIDFIKSMTQQYRSSNEIMFRHGIPKEHFLGIACQDDYNRQCLIDKLQKAGINDVNGKPINKFIKVRKYI
jgi:hypothetical protein